MTREINKRIEKIIVSNNPPENPHVLWLNPKNNMLHIFDINQWEPISSNDMSNMLNRDGSNYIQDLELVTPKIDVMWKIYDNKNTLIDSQTSTNLSVEYGAKVSCEGRCYYSSLNNNQKAPSGYRGNLFSGNGGQFSSQGKSFSKKDIINSTTYTVEFYSSKSGLEVKNNKVVKAVGEDKTSNSISVTFKHRLYWGTSEVDNLTDYSTLSTELSTSRKKNTTFNCSGGKYFYYVYPKALEKSTWKVGGLAFTGYELKEVSIINEYGKSIEYYVYRSKDIQYGGKINVEIT